MIQPMIVVTLPVLPLFVGFTLNFPLQVQLSALVVTVKSRNSILRLDSYSSKVSFTWWHWRL